MIELTEYEKTQISERFPQYKLISAWWQPSYKRAVSYAKRNGYRLESMWGQNRQIYLALQESNQ